MLLNYHIGRFVLGWLCVGDLVRLGLSGVRVAGFRSEIKYQVTSSWSFILQLKQCLFGYREAIYTQVLAHHLYSKG